MRPPEDLPRSDWQGEKMRLKGIKRREEQKLVVSMGGFQATVVMEQVGLGPHGDWGRSLQAVLRFSSSEAIPEHNDLRCNGLRNNRDSVWFESKQLGSFTEQAPELINRVSSILNLFPVTLVDFSTVTYFLVNRRWCNALELLDEEMALNKHTIKHFRARAEIPLWLEKNKVHLCTEGELVIKNNTVTFDPHGKLIEKETGLETSADEWFIAEAEFNFNQQILQKMSETVGQLTLKVNTRYRTVGNAESVLVYSSFEATGPIHGDDVIRWILRAALDCGVMFSLADLDDYDITAPSMTS